MSGYILCQGKRARFPYYIENISTNIYTLEELCYYLNHNIYLLDETILNEGLCRWILEELGLRKLYDKLYRMLDEKVPAGTFILPIFKEIHYLTMEEFRELNVRVQKLEQEPPLLRQKIKGDYLMENGKYVNAVRVYQKTLAELENGKMGAQFAGTIWYNLGCAYSRLFQMDEAVSCFEKALKLQPGEKTRKTYLTAVCRGQEEEVWKQMAEKAGADEEEAKEAFWEAKEAVETETSLDLCGSLDRICQTPGAFLLPEGEQVLAELAAEYHKNTGY